ncbi:MAG TPA: hypothetical protein DCL06_11300 [Corynebacterium variabile]|uniref:Uncharacterized protein n=1 Tax=Corynebacterium variabile TaxID=1727 RepID=A0A3B9QWE3_9CORY|nr:hypothetical protein [Corynebacterium variabile]
MSDRIQVDTPHAGIDHPPVIVWITPDGHHLHLAGSADEGAEGVYLRPGVDGIGSLDPSATFVQATHQIGETITALEYTHGELDIPLYILGTNAGDMQAIREWVKTLFPRDRAGWLAAWTPVTGWRWIRARRRSMKPALSSSPHEVKGVELDLVLIAEDPRAEEPAYSSLWRNTGLSGHGYITLCASPEWESWPVFTISGPGSVELSMEGSTITLPALETGERCLLQSDPARGVLRSVAADGTSRNRWPDVVGYLASPIPAGAVSHIGIRCTGAGEDTQVLGQARAYREGLM